MKSDQSLPSRESVGVAYSLILSKKNLLGFLRLRPKYGKSEGQTQPMGRTAFQYQKRQRKKYELWYY